MKKLWKTLTLIIAFAAGTLLLASANQSAAAAEEGLIPLESFGHLPVVSGPRLSPDGTHVATFKEVKGRLALVIMPILPGVKGKALAIPLKDAEFNWVRWIDNERLIVSFGVSNRSGNATDTTETRLFGVNRDGKKQKIFRLFAKDALNIPQYQDQVIDFLPWDNKKVLITLDKGGDGEDAVYALDPRMGSLDLVQKAWPNISRWITDAEGNVRLGTGIDAKNLQVLIVARRSVDDRMEALPTQTYYKDHIFRPAALYCGDPSRFYVWSSHENGRRGLYLYDLDDQAIVEKVFLHEKYDLAGIRMGKKTGCLVGVTYIVDTVETVYFEEPYASLYAAFEATFPGKNISLTSSSADLRYWLIRVDHSTLPPQYYFYDSGEGSIWLWAETYPGLNESNLMPKIPVTYQSRDGVEIPGYIIYPPGGKRENLPTVIVPHGGPESRDIQSFSFFAQFLANRGYLVFKPNFRGSAGFGDNFQAGALAAWGGTATNDIEDGAKWLVSQGIADPDRICAVGWSYGGYAALMSVIQSPEFYKCVISMNGVTNPLDLVKYAQRYTDSELTDERILGDRKKRDLKDYSPIHRADEIQVPVLLFHAKDDRNVRYKQSADMARALKKYKKDYRFVTLDDDSHYLEWEKNRMIFLKEMEAFLAKHIGD